MTWLKPLYHLTEQDLQAGKLAPMPIALIGFGVVGQGVARALCDLELDAVNPFRIIAIATSKGTLVNADGLDLRKALHAKQSRNGMGAFGSQWQPDLTVDGLLERDDIECYVEATPTDLNRGGEPTLTWIHRILDSKRHVVTANKGPFVFALRALEEKARACNVSLRYSAAVGGGIPVIETLAHGLGGNRILKIAGILNGSSNYILHVMHERKVDYRVALAEAQAAGITETDPTNDVEGLDAAAKGVILHNTAFEETLTLDRISRVGISHLTLEDVRAAEAQGKVYRLVVHLEAGKGIVSPRLIPYNAPLAIDGAKNVVTFTGDHCGDITISGMGAGQAETASAMVNDLWKTFVATRR